MLTAQLAPPVVSPGQGTVPSRWRTVAAAFSVAARSPVPTGRTSGIPVSVSEPGR